MEDKAEPMIFDVTLLQLEGGELKNDTFDSIKMAFAPRVGDVIEVDGYFFLAQSIMYSYKSIVCVTAYVDSLGDAVKHERWVKQQLKDQGIKPFIPDFKFPN